MTELEDQVEKIENSPKFKEGHLLLSGDGIFYTVQGEGPTVGCPAVFVRLHMCNLECDWSKTPGSHGEICDAWYTWKKDTKEYQTEHRLIDFYALREQIIKYRGERIIFTGGEPLMQQKHLDEFFRGPGITLLHSHAIEIETNGTYPFFEKTELYKAILKSKIQINCSPKLSGSNNHRQTIYSDVLSQINQFPLSYFKFVVSTPLDVEEIDTLVGKLGLFSEKIIIMPEGTSNDMISGDRMLAMIDVAKEHNWRVSPRLQCEVWGNKRGV